MHTYVRKNTTYSIAFEYVYTRQSCLQFDCTYSRLENSRTNYHVSLVLLQLTYGLNPFFPTEPMWLCVLIEGIAAEAVVFFEGPAMALASDFHLRLKRAGQTWSKMRFLSAQLLG